MNAAAGSIGVAAMLVAPPPVTEGPALDEAPGGDFTAALAAAVAPLAAGVPAEQLADSLPEDMQSAAALAWMAGMLNAEVPRREAPATAPAADAGGSTVAVATPPMLAAEAIAALRRAGVKTVMLTGDNPATAARIAQEVGIARFEAGVLPGNKASALKGLKAPGHLVGMAGDGINDAPALAVADVSFALACGSDIAIEAADVTLMRNDLNGVADAVLLSRATVRKIRQNLFFAFVYNVLGIPLAALGFLSPVIAGAAMAMSSVSVVTNSLSLRRWKPKVQEKQAPRSAHRRPGNA